MTGGLWCPAGPVLSPSGIIRTHWNLMPRVKVHYDGWIALPADIRRRLGLKTGDQLDLEWTDGGLMLRSQNATDPTDEHDVAPSEALEEPAPEPRTTPKPKAKPRQRGSAKLAGAVLPKTAGRKMSRKKATSET